MKINTIVFLVCMISLVVFIHAYKIMELQRIAIAERIKAIDLQDRLLAHANVQHVLLKQIFILKTDIQRLEEKKATRKLSDIEMEPIIGSLTYPIYKNESVSVGTITYSYPLFDAETFTGTITTD